MPSTLDNHSFNVAYFFPTEIHVIDKPDFLKSVSMVSDENLDKARLSVTLNDIYPVLMTDNYFSDERINDFVEFVGSTAWNILDGQGYQMRDRVVTFSEMWTQEHHKHSSMEQHIHGNGSQIVGFYFLETPENCSRVVFHDPRPAKVQINLSEKDINLATSASQMINFEPKPGMMIFSNSWLAHSFTRHASDKPIKFVHFNLYVQNSQIIGENSPAEII